MVVLLAALLRVAEPLFKRVGEFFPTAWYVIFHGKKEERLAGAGGFTVAIVTAYPLIAAAAVAPPVAISVTFLCGALAVGPAVDMANVIRNNRRRRHPDEPEPDASDNATASSAEETGPRPAKCRRKN